MASVVRIKLSSIDISKLNEISDTIKDIASKAGVTTRGPIPLPTEKSSVTVIKSPHVHKDSREQFEMRVHKRLIDLISPTQKTVDELMKLDLPAGVDVEIKLQ